MSHGIQTGNWGGDALKSGARDAVYGWVGYNLGGMTFGPPGAIVGGVNGAMAGRYDIYQHNPAGAVQFLVDSTWNLPNVAIGQAWGAYSFIRGGRIDPELSKDSGAFIMTGGKPLPGAHATTIGNFYVDDRDKAFFKKYGLSAHELTHVAQMRLFGSFFVPMHLGNMAILGGYYLVTGDIPSGTPDKWSSPFEAAYYWSFMEIWARSMGTRSSDINGWGFFGNIFFGGINVWLSGQNQ